MTSHPPATVACLGPEGSFSHEFALSRFPGALCLTDANSFPEVIKQLEEGTADAAVLPFLNSNGVDVRPAQAAIAQAREWISIDGCFPHKVIHNVVVAEGFKSLKKVVSKEQVFPQCTNWLRQWGGIETVAATSTSAALLELLRAPKADRESTAAICNLLAVNLYGGEVRWAGIQNPGNTTLFLVASRRQPVASEEEALICLTCPTEECYENAINDFSRAGMPLKFTSLKGEFTAELPCFLQFEIDGRASDVRLLVEKPHRYLVGSFPEEHSLAACVAGFFDDIY
jgi:prephenate dehydratase